MDDETRELRLTIDRARAYAMRVCERRALVGGMLVGAPGITTVEFEFPEPDTMHTWTCVFGRRMGEPAVYRLSFGHPLKWVGISHPWGLRPADIIVKEGAPCRGNVS